MRIRPRQCELLQKHVRASLKMFQLEKKKSLGIVQFYESAS